MKGNMMSNLGKTCTECVGCIDKPEIPWQKYTMDDVATRYGFQSNRASGITVGILAWGPIGKIGVDTTAVSDRIVQWGRAAPNFQVTCLGGQSNNNSMSGELHMDALIMGYFCCDAVQINIYIATLDTVYQAIQQASADGCYVTTCSFGIRDKSLTGDIDNALLNAKRGGMVSFFASGDLGAASGDKKGSFDSVVYPAASPHATAVGGTFVALSNTSEEVVWWNYPPDGWSGSRCWWASGGGVSGVYDVPSFQSNLSPLPTSVFTNQSGRGVPDVACMAEGMVQNLNHTDGGFFGTSAATPTFASLIASICAQISADGTSDGRLYAFNHNIYNPPAEYAGTLFTQITTGDNIPPSCSGFQPTGYTASDDAWNGCTGLGIPNGQNLYNMFSSLLGSSK